MNNQTRHKATASKFSLLRQLCNFIPPHLVPRLARETGVDDQARTFSPGSHVVSLLYAQLIWRASANPVGQPAPWPNQYPKFLNRFFILPLDFQDNPLKNPAESIPIGRQWK
jgi:hypothetical protein